MAPYNRLQRYAPQSISRSLPYIKILLKSKVNKSDLLQRFPDYVADDIAEILFNIVMGNVKTSKTLVKRLKRYKRPLLKLVNIHDRKKRRKYVYKQKGGFLASVLPVAISLIGGIIGNAIRKNSSK